jgi:hypothetical protein
MNYAMKWVLYLFFTGFFLFSAGARYANAGEKVLVYYFRDITGDERYTGLMYGIPQYMYSQLNRSSDKNSYVLIDREGLEILHENSRADLWSRNVLINVGKRGNIDKILFGSFYIQNNKPVLIGKAFYLKSGVILDINDDKELETIFDAVEGMDATLLSAREQRKGEKLYDPPLIRYIEGGEVRSTTVLHACGGTFYPLGKWSELYPPGILAEISAVVFPKMNVFPIGLGFDSNYIILRRRTDTGVIESDVTVATVGTTVQYFIKMRRPVDGVFLHVSVGASYSNLFINSESWSSIDPYIKAGVYMALPFLKTGRLTLKCGLLSIDYKERPIDALYTALGIAIY